MDNTEFGFRPRSNTFPRSSTLSNYKGLTSTQQPSSSSTNPTSKRRNIYGDLSYADIITKAINSSPDKKLMLSQIYDWMIANIPYFGERADKCKSSSWKNSVRHNLSLHNRFLKVSNPASGKSSWWLVNPNHRRVKPERKRTISDGGKNGRNNVRTIKSEEQSKVNTSLVDRFIGKQVTQARPHSNPEFGTSRYSEMEVSESNSTVNFFPVHCPQMMPIEEYEPNGSYFPDTKNNDYLYGTMQSQYLDQREEVHSSFPSNIIKDEQDELTLLQSQYRDHTGKHEEFPVSFSTGSDKIGQGGMHVLQSDYHDQKEEFEEVQGSFSNIAIKTEQNENSVSRISPSGVTNQDTTPLNGLLADEFSNISSDGTTAPTDSNNQCVDMSSYYFEHVEKLQKFTPHNNYISENLNVRVEALPDLRMDEGINISTDYWTFYGDSIM